MPSYIIRSRIIRDLRQCVGDVAELRFHCSAAGGYVWLRINDGELHQPCEGGGLRGVTLTCDGTDADLRRVARRWYRQATRGERAEPRAPRVDYVLRELTGAHWPGALPWRGPSSRRGYATAEAAHARAWVVARHYNARHGRGLDFEVVRRER